MLFLLLAAELVDRRRAEADGGLERDADTGIRARDFLDCDAERKKIPACPSHVFGKRQPEKAELAHLADDVIAKLVMPVELLRRRRDHLAREVATRIPNRLLLLSQFKIHCINRYMWMRGT